MSGKIGPQLVYGSFPDLNAGQKQQIERLLPLYRIWNEKINVISRRDLDNLYERHVLHSLTIAKFISFKAGSSILDLGTGGGFPGIPLAILFPQVKFHLIDARAKKITVVDEIVKVTGLKNVRTTHTRVEDLRGKYDFVVSRAVAPLKELVEWSRPLIGSKHINAIPNGLICLKGGDLMNELKSLGKKAYFESEPVKKWFDRAYFKEKSIIYVQL